MRSDNILSRRKFLAATALAALSARTAVASQCPRRVGCVRLCDGRRLAYHEFGPADATPVLYCHGMPGSSLEAALIEEEAWQANARVIAPDRPGIGDSTFQSKRRILDWPQDVAQLMNCLGINCFTVVGVSGGAPFALAVALCLSQRVQAAAIVSGHTPFGVSDVDSGSQDMLVRLVAYNRPVARAAIACVKHGLDRHPDMVLQKVTKSWSDADRQLIFCNSKHRCDLLGELRRALHCPKGLAHDVGLLARSWDFCLSCVKVPVYIYQGCCDEITPPSMGRHFHRCLSNSSLVLDPCTSHVTTVKKYAAQYLSLGCTSVGVEG